MERMASTSSRPRSGDAVPAGKPLAGRYTPSSTNASKAVSLYRLSRKRLTWANTFKYPEMVLSQNRVFPFACSAFIRATSSFASGLSSEARALSPTTVARSPRLPLKSHQWCGGESACEFWS